MQVSKSSEIDFEQLKFMRVFTPMHVPKALIEQVKCRTFEVDDWYTYLEGISTRNTPNGPALNPLSLLYVIADEGNKVVGMLWCEMDALCKVLIIQTFSMDKEYWLRGKAVGLLAKKVKEIVKECKLKKVYWNNPYPKHGERYGFKRSKTVLMEWEPENEVKEEVEEDVGSNVRISETHGECPNDDTGADGGADAVTPGARSGGEPSDNESSGGRSDGPGPDAGHIPAVVRGPSDDELRAADAASYTTAVC